MIATLPRRLRLGATAPATSAQVEVLRTRGALLEVRIGLPAAMVSGMVARGSVAPQPRALLAMIDTGASMTAISQNAAEAIGLSQTGAVQMGGIGGTGMKPVYAASLGFGDPSITPLDPIQIAGVDLPSTEFHVLIGRDVLKYLVLTYDGPRGVFALAPGGNAPPPSAGATFVQPAGPVAGSADIGSLNVGEFPTALVVAGVGLALLNIFDVF